MKIIVVGGTGTIGQAVAAHLKNLGHTVLCAGLQKGDIQVDITNLESIENMYKQNSNIDAVISTTGKVKFVQLPEFNYDQYMFGLNNKLMGQVNLVTVGIKYLNKGGSFTLTSGILNHDPIKTGASAAMVNGALDSFVKAAAIELPNNLRINIISPTVLTESLSVYAKFFPGYESVDAQKVAHAYQKSVEGIQTGQIYKVGYTT